MDAFFSSSRQCFSESFASARCVNLAPTPPPATAAFLFLHISLNVRFAGLQTALIRSILIAIFLGSLYQKTINQLISMPVSLAGVLILLGTSIVLQIVRLYHNRNVLLSAWRQGSGSNALTTQLLNLGSSEGAVPHQIHCRMSTSTHNHPTPPLSRTPLSPCPPHQAPNPKNLLPPNPPQLSRFARLKSSIASARGCMIRIWSDVGHAATCGYIYLCTYIFNYQSLIKSHLFFAYLYIYDYQSFIKSHLFFAFALLHTHTCGVILPPRARLQRCSKLRRRRRRRRPALPLPRDAAAAPCAGKKTF